MDIHFEEAAQSALSKSERRKTSKPVMERRRRERINKSLNELKNLLLESRKKDNSRCSKLEKADILEMTVQHLKAIRAQQRNYGRNDPVALAHYKAGFNQSAAEISRYLVNAQDIQVEVRTRLLTHLSSNLQGVLGNQPFLGNVTSPCHGPTPTVHQHPSGSTEFSPTPTSPRVFTETASDNQVQCVSLFTACSGLNTISPISQCHGNACRDDESVKCRPEMKPVNDDPISESDGLQTDPPVVWRPW